jgi:hypothetical protein
MVNYGYTKAMKAKSKELSALEERLNKTDVMPRSEKSSIRKQVQAAITSLF